MSETEVVEPVHAPAEAKNVSEVKEAATPLDNGSNKNFSAEKAVTAQKPKETVAETAAAAAPVNGAKKSFAAMVSLLFFRVLLFTCALYLLGNLGYRLNQWREALLLSKSKQPRWFGNLVTWHHLPSPVRRLQHLKHLLLLVNVKGETSRGLSMSQVRRKRMK